MGEGGLLGGFNHSKHHGFRDNPLNTDNPLNKKH